jgi:hypothetical protein
MAGTENGRTLDSRRTALGYVCSGTADRRSLRRFSENRTDPRLSTLQSGDRVNGTDRGIARRSVLIPNHARSRPPRTKHRKNPALRNEASNDPKPRSTERSADGELPATPGRAREHQTGDRSAPIALDIRGRVHYFALGLFQTSLQRDTAAWHRKRTSKASEPPTERGVGPRERRCCGVRGAKSLGKRR